MMSWYLKTFQQLSTNELYAILKERVNIFVVEQNCPYPEIDDNDQAAYHLFKVNESNEENKENGDVMAYLRILPSGVVYKEASFGRVIVKEQYRGLGLAKEMIDQAMYFLQYTLNEHKIKIQAQDYLRDFYASFGFDAISGVYLEDGIPHVDMIFDGTQR